MTQLTPKQKAKELVFGFYKIVGLSEYQYDCIPINTINKGPHKIAQIRAKKCALKCVKEILESINNSVIVVDEEGNYIGEFSNIKYYKKVKQEIKKL